MQDELFPEQHRLGLQEPDVKRATRPHLPDELCILSQVSLTSDLWQSKANDGYILLTVHFVKEAW